MIITICNKQFELEQINDISITATNVFIDTEEDFYNLRYTNEEQIQEAKTYLKFKKLQKEELMEAVMLLITTCNYFINSKTQCSMCPLKRQHGCIFYSVPIDWRN